MLIYVKLRVLRSALAIKQLNSACNAPRIVNLSKMGNAVSVASILDRIPMAAEKSFPSTKALGVITDDPGAVSKGRDVYKTKSCEGSLKIYKQKILKMDQETLIRAVEVIKRDWEIDMNEFRSFKMLIASTTQRGWSYDTNTVEELEHNVSNTHFLFYHVTRNEHDQYNFAICHLKSDTALQNNVMIAGLMIEGLLGKDEQNRLYLQF